MCQTTMSHVPIEHVKVLVAKVSRNLVDVFFSIDLVEGIQQITSPDLSGSDLARMALVNGIENAGNDSDRILFLKFSVRRKKLQTGMIIE